MGILLGMGAPLSHVFLQIAQTKVDFFEATLGEFRDHGFLLALCAPLLVGVFGFFLGLLQDKLALQERKLEIMTVRLKRLSITDDITTLYNHRHMLVEIEREVERAKRYGRMLSGMMIDIDDFKKVNDQHGHLAGDRLLREIADKLQQSIRKVDILGRYAGDEFFIILPETDLEASKVVAERIQKNINTYSFRLLEAPIAVTVSIGIFSFPAGRELNFENFINQADQMLLQAKRAGKNQILAAQA